MEFDKADYSQYQLDGLPNESGFYHGEIIKWAMDEDPHDVLFAGETRAAARLVGQKLGVSIAMSIGLGDADYRWDFNDDLPWQIEGDSYDLIISQAILEHIVNPYGFVENLVALLSDGGCMILHTVQPGFPYHKAPIDCLCFFPDWFVDVAQRLGLKIIRAVEKEVHLFFMFRKGN